MPGRKSTGQTGSEAAAQLLSSIRSSNIVVVDKAHRF
jgi:hypothetical protein